MSLENAGDFEYQAKKARLSLGLLRSLRRQFTEGFRLRGPVAVWSPARSEPLPRSTPPSWIGGPLLGRENRVLGHRRQ